MPDRDVVGGHADQPASEEAHRLAANQAAAGGASDAPAGANASLSRWTRYRRLAGSRRFRLQAAGLIALAFILLLAVALPARQVRITADGDVTTVSSRGSSEVTLAERAGVKLEPGDRVEEAGDGDLVVHRAAEATLAVDGQTIVLRTQADTIEEALSQAEIPFAAEDSILRDDVFVSSDGPVAPPPPLAAVLTANATAGSTPPNEESVSLEVRRAVPFSVIENGQELQLRSSRENVATALRDVGVRLGPGDQVQPPLDTELTAGLQIHIEHAAQVIVTLPAGKTIIYTLGDTVGEALAESGIELPLDYRLNPPAETPVVPGLVVHVVGVSEEQVLETERIESRTVYEPDPTLPYGERRVVEGQDGVLYRQYSVVFENGAVISRELVAEWYDPEPIDTVIYYSTADLAPGAPAGPPDSGGPGETYVSTMRVWATWYNAASSGKSPSDPSYGITATGVPVDRGIIAVDPSVIPLGTRMYIPGYGYGIAADTGGGIQGYMIDLGYPGSVIGDWITGWVEIYILGP